MRREHLEKSPLANIYAAGRRRHIQLPDSHLCDSARGNNSYGVCAAVHRPGCTHLASAAFARQPGCRSGLAIPRRPDAVWYQRPDGEPAPQSLPPNWRALTPAPVIRWSTAAPQHSRRRSSRPASRSWARTTTRTARTSRSSACRQSLRRGANPSPGTREARAAVTGARAYLS